MKLSTGKVAFPIEFDNGDKQNIYFNPSDPDLAIRFDELHDRVSEAIQGLEDYDLKADGTPENNKSFENFKHFTNIIKSEIDRAFGSEVSSIVFKYNNPFSIVNGDYFVVQFINAIMPDIEKHIKKANAEVEKKMQKHIAKYQKK